MSKPTKKAKIQEYLLAHPDATTKSVADKFGAHISTVAVARNELTGGGIQRSSRQPTEDHIVDPDHRRRVLAKDILDQLALLQRRVILELT